MEKREPRIDSNDIIMQQYPSPTTDGQDIAYYDAHPRDQLEPPLDPNMEQHVVEQPQEPALPHQRERPSVSVEELQLAAQLSQGLAPMLENANHREDEHGLLNQEEESMQNHDPNIHNQEGNLHGQDPNLQPQDLASQSAMPPLQPPQQHQYMQAPPAPTHLAPHVQMAQMAQQVYAAVDSTPPRKRSKVSRACDECRRKKVKCDAVSETGDEQCTNCRKAQMACLFSRVPQKRGPSKGYIKELADRINSIEGKLGGQAGSTESLELAAASRRESTEAFPSPALNDNAKRPFASISGADPALSTPTANRLIGWASDPRSSQNQSTPSNLRAPYTGSKLAPVPANSRPAQLPTTDVVDEVNEPSVEPQGDQILHIDEIVYLCYLTVVHPTLPLLPSSQSGLEDTLAECPPLLRRAFVSALQAAIYSFQSTSAAPVVDARSSYRILSEYEMEEKAASPVVNLIHLRTLILLAIEADSHGPGRLGSSSKPGFLARAVSLAYSMQLPEAQYNLDIPHDVESEGLTAGGEAIGVWCCLVALDRWNATGFNAPLLISQDTVILSADLKVLLGEPAYMFLKLSYTLGAWSEAIRSLTRPEKPHPSDGKFKTLGHAKALGQTIDALLETWRMELPASWASDSHTVIFLAYWHCRLLGYLLMPYAASSDVLWAAQELVQLLADTPELVTPLNHYFISLAGPVLAELAKIDKTRDEAAAAVTELMAGVFAPAEWDSTVRNNVQGTLAAPAPSVTAEATASQNLQRLADLATAGDEPRLRPAPAPAGPPGYEAMGFDPRPMLHAGYLNAARVPA